MAAWLSAFFTAWALVAGTFSAVALYRLWRRAAQDAERPTRLRRRPHVLLLRPVDAPTATELEALATPVDYAGELTQYVLSPFRPRLSSANVRWLPSDPLCGNRKVGHLSYALACLPRPAGTVVLCVDADVKVDGALVAALVDDLQDGAALSSASPRPDTRGGLGGHFVRGLLVQSHHAFEVLDVMSAGAKAVCGKAIALSSEAASELKCLTDCIGEDLELSTRLDERGLKVTMARAPAHVPQPERVPLADTLARFTRWMQVLRAHRPALFPWVPALFTPTPVLMVAASVLATPGLALALCYLVAARIALANRLDQRSGLRVEWLWAELLLLWCWARSLWRGRTVTWRGRTFALRPGGRMVPAVAPRVAQEGQ
jgi:ceramide glucosyltransferase